MTQILVQKEKKRLVRPTLLLDIYKRRTSLQKNLKEVGMEREGKRFLSCGFDKIFFTCDNDGCDDFGKDIEKKFWCDLRICPKCAERHATALKEKYLPHIKKSKKARSIYSYGLRFLTLTIPNQEDIHKGITLLYEGITRLRRRSYFKKNVNAGLGAIEMKIGFDNKWNIHAHLIIESNFLDMKSHLQGKNRDARFVQEWKKASQSQGVCYIELLNTTEYKYSVEGALNYTLDYLSKGQAHLNNIEKAVFLRFSKGRRLVFSFGKFYKLKKIKFPLLCKNCFFEMKYVGFSEFSFPSLTEIEFYNKLAPE